MPDVATRGSPGSAKRLGLFGSALGAGTSRRRGTGTRVEQGKACQSSRPRPGGRASLHRSFGRIPWLLSRRGHWMAPGVGLWARGGSAPLWPQAEADGSDRLIQRRPLPAPRCWHAALFRCFCCTQLFFKIQLFFLYLLIACLCLTFPATHKPAERGIVAGCNPDFSVTFSFGIKHKSLKYKYISCIVRDILTLKKMSH